MSRAEPVQEASPAPESGGARREFVSLMTSRVGEAPLRKPLFVEGSADLLTLCRELAQRGLSEALIRDGARVGVFTTTNLREALLSGRPPAEISARELAVFKPFSVSVEDELFEAMLLMLRHRVRRLVVTQNGEAVGLLSQLDLMAFMASHSHLIALEAEQAETVEDLGAAARQIDGLIRLLRKDGVKVETIARLVGELNRQIFRRLWELLAPEELRANSCLIVMGSEGRGEQIIKTDQDNALLLRDGFACPRLEEVTEAFTRALIGFGYPPCPGGIMLSRPLWRQPLAAFRRTLDGWIDGSDPAGALNVAIFLDAAAVAGDPALLEEARAHLDRGLSDNPFWLSRFAKAATQFGEERSWWSRLPGLRGREAAEIDLKKLAIFPIVHGVRSLALEARLKELGTAARLNGLVAAKKIQPKEARDLTEALHFLMALKLENNLRQIGEGKPPGNKVALADLGRLERQALSDCLAVVREFKRFLALHYRFDAI
ncbi:DUF294 nucleotidyltransferase-like domain-containing protein [Neomegalonema sp.]|uniref:DUF294 nucleotidyltransferase-like domain-containing protein n=1 Tax=Neomegalonema sp. TaxID=2039713 RepID=UPI00262AF66E|nr:DUF294 nucleotidyltransferase-like domain-containing protein [Neomegalonema sp.]MDD2867437.1 putative nucleotidyltransferase substrate binding domain-containing protein [Neomegalonema sp.]